MQVNGQEENVKKVWKIPGIRNMTGMGNTELDNAEKQTATAISLTTGGGRGGGMDFITNRGQLL